MTNHSNKESNNNEGLEKDPSAPKELGQEQSEMPSNHSRKTGHSKREIMEELSRARFPWDG